MSALDPTIDRCTCGDWRCDGICHTCRQAAIRHREVVALNIAQTNQLLKEAS